MYFESRNLLIFQPFIKPYASSPVELLLGWPSMKYDELPRWHIEKNGLRTQYTGIVRNRKSLRWMLTEKKQGPIGAGRIAYYQIIVIIVPKLRKSINIWIYIYIHIFLVTPPKRLYHFYLKKWHICKCKLRKYGVRMFNKNSKAMRCSKPQGNQKTKTFGEVSVSGPKMFFLFSSSFFLCRFLKTKNTLSFFGFCRNSDLKYDIKTQFFLVFVFFFWHNSSKILSKNQNKSCFFCFFCFLPYFKL